MAEAKKPKKAKEKIDFKHNLGVYFGLLGRYKGLFAWILIAGLLLETLKTVDKYLFKIVIDNGAEFVAENIARNVFVQILIWVMVAYIAMNLVKFVFKWVHLHLVNRIDANMMRDLKQKFFNHIVHLSHKFHTTHKTGSLISRLGRGNNSVERMTDVIVYNVAPLLFQLVVVSLSLVYFSWEAMLVVFGTVILFLIYSLIIQSWQQRSHIIANNTEDVEKGNVADIFTNIDSVKYFGKEGRIKSLFAKLTDKTRNALLKSWDYFRWLEVGQSFILAVGTFFVIYFPLMQFLDGNMTIGTLVFIYTIYSNIYFPLFSFVHGVRNFYRSMADFQALFQYGKIENDIKDKPGAKTLEVKKASIEFKNMDFSYGRRKLFENFELKVPKNKKVALVGHSGCGKSTLVKLLYRFYDVSGGEILVDGENIKNFKQESLRGEMSIVPQEAVLFDDTVYDNIAFSNPKAKRADVMAAIKFAQLDKIIESFPKKERTVVGERGVKLSGGEKQRVSIARAILANKKILVLDEATSALDSETEHEIQADLENLMKGRTSIIIAHRLSTIMTADKIIVMDKGKIVQTGTHKQLIRRKGQYRKLWELQKGGYIK